MRIPRCFASMVLTLGGLGFSTVSIAGPINFYATGVADVSGYVQFDDRDFTGISSQLISNSLITDLNLSVFGEAFTFADVVLDATVIDSASATPKIVNGSGTLADNGSLSIAFYPDGSLGTATDGDASLGTALPRFAYESFYAVLWSTETPSPVPAPATLALLCLGFLGLTLRQT